MRWWWYNIMTPMNRPLLLCFLYSWHEDLQKAKLNLDPRIWPVLCDVISLIKPQQHSQFYDWAGILQDAVSFYKKKCRLHQNERNVMARHFVTGKFCGFSVQRVAQHKASHLQILSSHEKLAHQEISTYSLSLWQCTWEYKRWFYYICIFTLKPVESHRMASFFWPN